MMLTEIMTYDLIFFGTRLFPPLMLLSLVALLPIPHKIIIVVVIFDRHPQEAKKRAAVG